MKHILTSAAVAALVAAFGVSDTRAQEKTIYLGGYGGSFERLLKEKILPTFEQENGAKIVYVPGNSTDTLAKLQAQKDNQELDVVFLDDGPMFQAINFGFCAPIADAEIFNDVYDIAKMGTDKAIGVGFVATGISYNKEMFAKNNWPAPTSWNDLADAKYEGKLVVPPITNTYGLHALIMMAKLNGGSETDIEPGFKAFEDKVGKNVLVFRIEVFAIGAAVLERHEMGFQAAEQLLALVKERFLELRDVVQDSLRNPLVSGCRSVNDAADGGEELLRIERLGDPAGRPDRPAQLLDLLGDLRGHDQDRRSQIARVFAQFLDEGEAAHDRHVEVGDDEVDLVRLQIPEPLFPVFRLHDVVARGAQGRVDHLPHGQRIVYVQNAHGHVSMFHCLRSGSRPRSLKDSTKASEGRSSVKGIPAFSIAMTAATRTCTQAVDRRSTEPASTVIRSPLVRDRSKACFNRPALNRSSEEPSETRQTPLRVEVRIVLTNSTCTRITRSERRSFVSVHTIFW